MQRACGFVRPNAEVAPSGESGESGESGAGPFAGVCRVYRSTMDGG